MWVVLSIKKPYKRQQSAIYKVIATGALGIEPSSGVLETLILPMNYAPKSLTFL